MKQGVAMKRGLAVYPLVIVTVLLLIPSAWATWGTSFRNMGKAPTPGVPACVQYAAGQVECIAQNQNHTLMVNEYKNGAWSDWTNLAGAVSSDPTCVSDNNNNLVCGVRSAANSLVATVFDGTSWSAFIDSKAQIFSDASCAPIRQGKVLCAARGVAGSLTTSTLDTTAKTWGKVSNVAATLTSAPSCASDNDRDVICAMNALVTATNDTIVVNRFDGAKWEGFLTLQGSISGTSPYCTPLGTKGQVVCFDRANNLGIYANMFKSGSWATTNWTGWRGITGGNIGPRVSCAMTTAGALACGVRYVPDSMMYAATFDGTTWSAFAKVGTKPIWDGPSCATLSSGKAICAVVGMANNQAGSVTGP